MHILFRKIILKKLTPLKIFYGVKELHYDHMTKRHHQKAGGIKIVKENWFWKPPVKPNQYSGYGNGFLQLMLRGV